jgi:hypothetical protein
MANDQLIKALQELTRKVRALEPEDCPAVIGMLEQLKAHAWAQMVEHKAGDQAGDDHLLDMAVVATKLNIPKCRVYELARQGKFRIVRIGKYIRMRPRDLSEYQDRLTAGN